MAFRKIELGALMRLDPAEARAKILAAVEASKGDVKAAAASLDVGRRTLHRYLTSLRVRPRVFKIRHSNAV